ncbi:hypothetical protein FSP39_004771 [Pinctada imbricata]|uniref:PARP-type domain-containing protein n=1 Tax=Pinctada imbricata TaxID=66713 RepID=A0AA88YKF3_PINIB|nr:hypothetical protein FSP39_004771 [Pinctada imbricata]
MSTKPIATEYAKSAKAGCKGCKGNIAKGALRVGFVGKANFGATAWYHYDCVWKENDSLAAIDSSKRVEELVDGLSALDKSDQEKLEKDLPKYSKAAVVEKKTGKESAKPSKPLAAEYAKSAKSTCKYCGKTIDKGVLRVGFTGKANFGATAWYHEPCIWKRIEDFKGIKLTDSVADSVEGFGELREEAREILKKKLPEVCGGKASKRKSDSGDSQATVAKKGKA